MDPIESIWKALTPSELLERYRNGEREFVGINLLKTEIAYILRARPSRVEFPNPPAGSFSLVELEDDDGDADNEEDDDGEWPYHERELGPPKWFHGNFTASVNPLWADYRFWDPEFQWFGSERFHDEELEDIPTKSLSGCDLQGINLTAAYLYPVDLSNSVLRRADLKKAKLIDVDLHGADLRYVDLRRATLLDCDLRDVDLHMARLDRAAFINCDLTRANLGRAKLRKTIFGFSDLREANLRYSHFSETVLDGSHLEGINFKDVELPLCRVHQVSINTSQVSEFLNALEVRISDK